MAFSLNRFEIEILNGHWMSSFFGIIHWKDNLQILTSVFIKTLWRIDHVMTVWSFMTIRFLFTSNLNFSHAKTSWPSFKSCYLVFHASKILLENHMILVCRLRTVKIRSIRASRTAFSCPGPVRSEVRDQPVLVRGSQCSIWNERVFILQMG